MVPGIQEPEVMEVVIKVLEVVTLTLGVATLEAEAVAASPEAEAASPEVEAASQEAEDSGLDYNRRTGSSTTGTSRGSLMIKSPWPPTTATTATMAARSGESNPRATGSPNYLSPRDFRLDCEAG